ncbi:PilC/PilY family type IV pilus protein [Neisseria gonorrhoeae]|uniref:PilC/PilY family type IV pilus protein n=1 Tax=Neisseria gonorrhoeae TaxID=485 RepID=UPI002DDA7F55|nr:PilC/PilY family type IV pilus protein [Neisseria gonorrhoeae]
MKLSYIPARCRANILITTLPLSKTPPRQELRTFAEKGYVGDRYGVDGGFVCAALQMTRTGKNFSLCLVRWPWRQRRIRLGF